MTKELVEEQEAPVPNEGRPIWDLVIEDMIRKHTLGTAKYGTPLQAHNGRDALRDAYQEALDHAVYLRQEIEERTPSWQWLKSTYLLQTETYLYDIDRLAKAAEPDAFNIVNIRDLADYIKWNLLASYQELGELGVEFSWKPWATDVPFVNRRRILDETVDVLHFLGNILVGMGVTDQELESAYRSKQEINRQRQASGSYSAKKGGLGEGSDNV